MKMSRFFLVLVCFISLGGQAQERVIIEDFENGKLNFTQVTNMMGKCEWQLVDNPVKDKINSSNKVYKFIRKSSEPVWAGFWAELNEPLKKFLDVKKFRYVHVKYMRTSPYSRLRLKLERSAGGPFIEFFGMQEPTTTGRWEIITFDLKANNANDLYNVISFQPDVAANQPDGVVAYIDDINMSNDPEPGISFTNKTVKDLSFGNLYSNSMRLDWQPVYGASSYEVLNNGKKIKTVSFPFAQLSNLKPNSINQFQIVALNSKGTRSKACAALKVKTLAKGILAQPGNLHFSTRDSSSVTLKWNEVAGATGYEIYKNNEKIVTTNADSVAITSLSPYTKYLFAVKAINNKGESSSIKKLTVATLETAAQRAQRMAWWHHDKFGMFIHWGVYSALEGCYKDKCQEVGKYGEWIMSELDIPVNYYRQVAKEKFTAANYHPEQWVSMAKQAGMKYIVLTSKHHEGFALFNSKVSDWNAVQSSPAKRDLLAPLVKAAKDSGMKIGFYYSQALDWVNGGSGRHWDKLQDKRTFDQYIDEVAIPQLREILTQYGKLDLLWWDMPIEMTDQRAKKFLEVVHEMYDVQKNLVINDRLGGSYMFDHNTPEQSIPDMPSNGRSDGRDWETCMTLNHTWGYTKADTTWKSSTEIIHKLTDIVSKGGNFLLNIGPKADGSVPIETITRFDTVGKWMAINGESIYGTAASPFTTQLPWGRCTQKVLQGKKILYFHVWNWPENGELIIPGIKNNSTKVYLLSDVNKNKLKAEVVNDGLRITVPLKAPDNFSSTLVMEE